MDQFNEVRIIETVEDIQKHREQDFERDADKLKSWIKEKLQRVTDEYYRYPNDLHDIQEKHQELESEFLTHSQVIVSLDNTGQKMISQQHPSSDVIQRTAPFVGYVIVIFG